MSESNINAPAHLAHMEAAPPAHKNDLPMADAAELELIQSDPTKTLNIDNCPRQIRYYGETATIVMGEDKVCELSFQPETEQRRIVIDDSIVVFADINAKRYTEFMIDGVTHTIKIGSPTRELWIDSEWHECSFKQKIRVRIGSVLHSVVLEGNPPSVVVGEPRPDLCPGYVHLIIDGNADLNSSPRIFLDAKPQLVEIAGKPHILKFVERYQKITINGHPFSADFGGSPMVVSVMGRKHFLRLTNRPQRTNQLDYMKNVVLKGLWKNHNSSPFRGSSKGFEASINLKTIKSKMENFDYWTSAEAIQDFKTMFSDCSLLYKPHEDIFNKGNALEKFFWARMKNMPEEEKILNGAKSGHSSNQVQQLSTVINGTAETNKRNEPVEKRKREEKSEAESENKKARVDAAPYCLVCQQSGHEMSTKCATCLACGDKGHVRKDCDAPKVIKSEGENIEQNGHVKENRTSDNMEVNNDEVKHEEDAEGSGISINKREEDESERKRESDEGDKENDNTARESNPSSDAPRVNGSSSSPNNLHNEIEILHRQVADCVKKRLDMYMVGQAGTEPKNIKIKDSDEYTRLAKFFSHKLRAQIKETYEQYNRTLKGVAITADNKEQIKVEIDMYFDTQPVVEDETDMQDVQPRTQEEQPLQRNNVHAEERQIFIKNFHSDFKTLKDAIKQHGRFDKINKVGQKMVIVTMKSTEGAALAIRNLQGQRIGKHIIKVGPYKTKEQLRKEKAEKEKEEKRRREESFEKCDTSEVKVVWETGQQS